VVPAIACVRGLVRTLSRAQVEGVPEPPDPEWFLHVFEYSLLVRISAPAPKVRATNYCD